jgi:hypothetical protein
MPSWRFLSPFSAVIRRWARSLAGDSSINARRVPDMPTRYPYQLRDNPSPSRDFATGASLSALTPYERERLERDGLLRPAVTPPYPVDYLGETPTDGQEAAECWLDLHDHAVKLRAQLHAGDVVQTTIVRRALRSVLLYEHQITPKARRLARLTLWSRTHIGPLPPFSFRVRWGQCQCARCQAAAAQNPQEVIVLASA